jgi:pyruvate kinase
LALSDAKENANKLSLTFGCFPMVAPTFKSSDEIMDIVRKFTLDKKLAKRGDKVIIVAGMPFGASSETNFIMVETL